ncbi:hypothetical protein [Hymenobacter canadensis]|uniref:Uncharacterized protein n=1 Tax=Hymenobacter canadensis TaxID=2999067 RepID=A0ABY7LTZ2_9BACT|nr:hypothetical protein [Hymenobacter canadensis]WBA42877.1 hypothetical protein O3303_04775 [Hymenobacter canadensis]
MKYILTLAAVLTIQQAQAQIGLIMGGTRAAVSVATLAARQKKAKAAAPKDAAPKAEGAAATPTLGRGVTLFTYHGENVQRKRTTEATFKGKGGPEILALEALLEQRHQALLADSTASVLTPEQLTALTTAARTAATARPDWNYAPYQQELAFYQKEEQRRQPAAQPVPAK